MSAHVTTPPPESGTAPLRHAAGAPTARSLIKLARPEQWAKGAFVLIGPLYGQALTSAAAILAVLGAFLAFGFASSACYVVNRVSFHSTYARANPICATNIIRYMCAHETWFSSTARSSGRRRPEIRCIRR